MTRTVWAGRARNAVAMMLAAFVLGACAKKGTPKTEPAASNPGQDTTIAMMAPHLASWLGLWRLELPGVTLDSLRLFAEGPLTLRDIHPFDPGAPEHRGRVEVFGEYSPDSTRVVIPDEYLVVGPDGAVAGEPDSKPVLVDLKTRSVATLEFCGTGCNYDGAFWMDTLRFALTGLVSLDDSTGARCGRVLYYDLGSGSMKEYRLPKVAAAKSFVAARDSAWSRRYAARQRLRSAARDARVR